MSLTSTTQSVPDSQKLRSNMYPQSLRHAWVEFNVLLSLLNTPVMCAAEVTHGLLELDYDGLVGLTEFSPRLLNIRGSLLMLFGIKA